MISGNTIYRAALLAILITLAGVVGTKADSVTDPGTNVSYTMTSTFVPDSAGNFDVMVTIDASHFLTPDGATSGFLSALAVQFPGTNSAVLLSAPGGLDLWGNNQNLAPNAACELLPIGGLGVGFTCIANTSPNTFGAVPAKLTFVFGVPVLNSTDNIFALYAATSNGAGVEGGTIIGETPVTNIAIQNTNSGGSTGGSSGGGGGGGTPVPEPGVLTLLSTGLVAWVVFQGALMARPKASTI